MQKGKLSDGAGKVLFDGHWLTIDFPLSIKIEKERTSVRLVDKSYITPDDRSFHLIIDQPTFGFNFQLRLEGAERSDWSLGIQPSVPLGTIMKPLTP